MSTFSNIPRSTSLGLCALTACLALWAQPAAALAALEISRANDFAFWRALGTRLADVLPRRAAVAQAPVQVEKRTDPA